MPGVTSHIESNGRRWTLERWFMVLTFVVSLLSISFTAGLNWSKVSRLEADLEAHQKTTAADYVRKDVLQLELQTLRITIENLNRQLAEHTRVLEQVGR